MNWEQRNRKVKERWFIEGTLELVTPTSLSNGDDDPLVDLPVVVDPLNGMALLTGASLAGALRSYLEDHDKGHAKALFGGERGRQEEDDTQSPLIVEDALGETPEIELRDGVSIDPATRTAKDRERYDRQLLAAGTTFDLAFELVLAEGDNAADVKAALATALQGLEQGEIRLGGRKRRGYGECRVTSWSAWRYDLSTPVGIQGWLAHKRADIPGHESAHWSWQVTGGGEGISQWDALKDVGKLSLKSNPFELTATFAIDGAVLIRHGFEAETGPDVMHLTSHRGGDEPIPIMSGTSLAGVIRGQALRIARTVAGPNRDRADDFVDSMFGVMERPTEDMSPQERRGLKKIAGRVRVDESIIDGHTDLVQTRVKIDRFTGGAFESALFAEQPAFGGRFDLKVALRPPHEAAVKAKLPKDATHKELQEVLIRQRDAEVGLLLLVLKDLWTGFLPVGGSSSVGRGRLKGKSATIRYDGHEWEMEANDQALTITSKNGADATTLNEYVKAFTREMQGGS